MSAKKNLFVFKHNFFKVYKKLEQQEIMSRKLSCVDLFCGAGGFSAGFLKEDIRVLLGIDNDAAAIDTFNSNHNNVGMLADLRELTSDEVIARAGQSKIDIVIGGPPCQGLSLSGSREATDPRNRLYKSFVRIVKDINPQVVVLENVPGLVSLFKGKIKNQILKEFTGLGYVMNFQILLASEYGVPQHRKRVFFVGVKTKKFEFPLPTHLEEFNYSPNVKQMITCQDALSDLPLLENGDLGSDIQLYPSSEINDYQRSMRENSTYIYNHIAAKHSERVKSTISLVPPGKNYKSLPVELRETRKFNVAWTRFPDDKPAPTIDTGHRHHFHYSANRVPTVRECARLQSFTDDFIFSGNKTQQFRQVGNAVPPFLAQTIARSIKEQILK